MPARGTITSVAGALVLAFAMTHAVAGTISLRWDPVSAADGYRVYYGTASGNYTDYVNVGNTTQATLNIFADCTTYYLAVKAVNQNGESANYSNQIVGWARPEIHTVSPDTRMQGSQLTVQIDGTNFMPGASLAIDNPNVFVDSVSASCGRLTAALTVEPLAEGVRAAEVGAFRIEVVNPDDVYGERSNGFRVLIDPSRFDLNDTTESSRGRVDGQDTIQLATTFGASDGGGSYDPDCDLDGNGWIDGDDLSYLAAEFGECWNGQGWNLNACPESVR